MVLCRFWIWKRVARVRLLRRFNGGPLVGPDSAVLLLRFLLKIRSVRILDTIICSEAFLWLFSPTWDSVKLTLKVGFICPFMVIDPTDLGTTIVVTQDWCLTIFNLSTLQNTCLFANGNKASVCVMGQWATGGTHTVGGRLPVSSVLLEGLVWDCTAPSQFNPNWMLPTHWKGGSKVKGWIPNYTVIIDGFPCCHAAPQHHILFQC